jgi:hypothetical protein
MKCTDDSAVCLGIGGDEEFRVYLIRLLSGDSENPKILSIDLGSEITSREPFVPRQTAAECRVSGAADPH